MPHRSDRKALYTSGSDEWYTPPELARACAAFLGTIDLDPCADPGCSIPATRHIVGLRGEDGLSVSWAELRVFVNPPYSQIAAWAAKFAVEPMREGLLLVPGRIETRWMQRTGLCDLPMCCIAGRLKFAGGKHSATFPSLLIYRGERVNAFIDAFDPAWGYVTQRLRSAQQAQNTRHDEHGVYQPFLCLSA